MCVCVYIIATLNILFIKIFSNKLLIAIADINNEEKKMTKYNINPKLKTEIFIIT